MYPCLGYPRGDYERPSSLPSLQSAAADVFGLADCQPEIRLPRRKSWIGSVVHSYARTSSVRCFDSAVARYIGRGHTCTRRGEKHQTRRRHGRKDCCHGSGGSSAICSVAQKTIGLSHPTIRCPINLIGEAELIRCLFRTPHAVVLRAKRRTPLIARNIPAAKPRSSATVGSRVSGNPFFTMQYVYTRQDNVNFRISTATLWRNLPLNHRPPRPPSSVLFCLKLKPRYVPERRTSKRGKGSPTPASTCETFCRLIRRASRERAFPRRRAEKHRSPRTGHATDGDRRGTRSASQFSEDWKRPGLVFIFERATT